MKLIDVLKAQGVFADKPDCQFKTEKCACVCVCVLRKVVVVVGQCTCNTLYKHSVVTTQHDSTFDLVKFEGHTKNTCPHPTKKKKKERLIDWV